MSTVPPTFPIKAYGVTPPQTPARPSASPEARAAGATDRVELQSSRPASVDRLVAARVQTPVDFAPARLQDQAQGELTIYRHPADRNAAAVGVDLGRQLDLRG